MTCWLHGRERCSYSLAKAVAVGGSATAPRDYHSKVMERNRGNSPASHRSGELMPCVKKFIHVIN